MGFGGFMLCVMSCGMLAPISLIMSLIGLRRGPGFFSVTGAILSTIALVGMALSIGGGVAEDHYRHARVREAIQQREVRKQINETNSIMVEAEKVFRQYKSENDGLMPSPMAGAEMAVEYQDAWGNELRYEPLEGKVLLRSAGADRQYDTGDDCIRAIPGDSVDDYKIVVEVEPETDGDTEDALPKSRSDSYHPLD